MLALSNSSDPEQQRFGGVGASYFMGRIVAKEPNFDFASLKAIGAKLDQQSAQTDMQQRCGPLFAESLRRLTAALGKPESPAPGTPPRK
jgi:hypothetical protein